MDMEPEQILVAGIVVNMLAALYLRRRRVRRLREGQQRKRTHRVWVHEMNQSRDQTSVFNRFNQLKEFPDRFHSQFRMTPQTFQYLLQVSWD